jgi:hypothetical protein
MNGNNLLLRKGSAVMSLRAEILPLMEGSPHSHGHCRQLVSESEKLHLETSIYSRLPAGLKVAKSG